MIASLRITCMHRGLRKAQGKFMGSSAPPWLHGAHLHSIDIAGVVLAYLAQDVSPHGVSASA